MAADVDSSLQLLQDRCVHAAPRAITTNRLPPDVCCAAGGAPGPLLPPPNPAHPCYPASPAPPPEANTHAQHTLSRSPTRPRLLKGVPPEKLPAGDALLTDAEGQLKSLQLAIKTQQPDFVGLRVSDVLKTVSRLEVLQAPGL